LISSAKNLIYLDERGQTRVFTDAVVTERSMDFVKLEIIGELIRGVVVSQSLRQEETIMILPSGIIVSLSHENQRATVEFGSEFENSLIMKDDKVHINAELLAAITEYRESAGFNIDNTRQRCTSGFLHDMVDRKRFAGRDFKTCED
jgi:hypothetical protein